jgi:hypothetical protein
LQPWFLSGVTAACQWLLGLWANLSSKYLCSVCCLTRCGVMLIVHSLHARLAMMRVCTDCRRYYGHLLGAAAASSDQVDTKAVLLQLFRFEGEDVMEEMLKEVQQLAAGATCNRWMLWWMGH